MHHGQPSGGELDADGLAKVGQSPRWLTEVEVTEPEVKERRGRRVSDLPGRAGSSGCAREAPPPECSRDAQPRLREAAEGGKILVRRTLPALFGEETQVDA